MCFSVGSSFGIAAGLSVMGLLSLQKASHTKKLIPIAASPLFFAVQQACEGIVWLTLNSGDSTSMLHLLGMYGFLFFASLWWPFWIPYALYTAETKPSRKKLLRIMLGLGLCTGIILFLSWPLQTTGAHVVNHHIDYPVANYPFGITNTLTAQVLTWMLSLSYCVATVTPLFISSIPHAWIMGIAISCSLVISYLFYFMAFPSVWCFFAAVCSILMYFMI
jgi:hypothetical protein